MTLDTLYPVRGETVHLFTCIRIQLVSYPQRGLGTRLTHRAHSVYTVVCCGSSLFLLSLSLSSFSIYPYLPLPVHTANSINLDPTDHTPSSPLPLSGHRLLSRLRKGAFLLYQSQPLGIVITRLEVGLLIIILSLSFLPLPTHYLPFSSFSPIVSELHLPPSSLTHPHTHMILFLLPPPPPSLPSSSLSSQSSTPLSK